MRGVSFLFLFFFFVMVRTAACGPRQQESCDTILRIMAWVPLRNGSLLDQNDFEPEPEMATAAVAQWKKEIVSSSSSSIDLPSFLDKFLPPASSDAFMEKGAIPDCVNVRMETNSEEEVDQVVNAIALTRVRTHLYLSTSSEVVVQHMAERMREKRNFEAHVQLLSEAGSLVGQRSFTVASNPAWKTLDFLYRTTNPFMIKDASGAGAGGGDDDDSGADLSGVDMEVWRTIADRLGLGATFRLTRTYVGMTGQLVNGSGDLAIGQPSHSYERFRMGVDLSKPIVSNAVYFACKNPGPADQLHTTLYPFETLVWVGLLASMLLIMLCLLIINALGGRATSMFHVASVSYVALISEAMPDHYLSIRKRKLAAYVVLFVWILIASLVSHAYKSTLLASLIAVEYEKPMDTFQDLLDNDMILPFGKGSVITPLMRDSASATIRQVYENTERRGGLYDGRRPQWISKMVEEGRAASLTTSVFIVGTRHKVRPGKEGLPTAYSGYYYMLKHPFKQDFDEVIGRFQDFGIILSLLDRGLFAKALPEREHARSPDLDPGPDPLGLRHALAMMLAAWIGMAAAAVALVGEMMAAPGRLRRILLSRRRGRGGGGGGGRGQGMVVMVGRRF